MNADRQAGRLRQVHAAITRSPARDAVPLFTKPMGVTAGLPSSSR